MTEIGLDVLKGMQNAEFLGNLDTSIVDQEIKFNNIREPRNYKTDLSNESNEENWRTSLLFERPDSSLISIGISQFVNFDYIDKDEKKGKMFAHLNTLAEGGKVKFTQAIAFAVDSIDDLLDNNGNKRYPRNAYKAWDVEVEKAKSTAKAAQQPFSVRNWDVPQSVKDQCTGEEGLKDNAKTLKTLVLKAI